MHQDSLQRRSLLKTAAAFAAFETLLEAEGQGSEQATLKDVPLGPTVKLTVERRGQIVLLGINRPEIQNRIDPETSERLGRAYYDYEHDPTLRAAILFGHGPHFSRGIDVDAFAARVREGTPSTPNNARSIDPLAKSGPHLSKPVIVVTHGDTWNMAHELMLAADFRIASEDTNFGQDENTHGRFPGGGATVRFVREVGWGNAMRYMLTGDHWTAQEAFRMGEVQMVAATPDKALEAAIAMATRVAACAPLGIKATLASAHLALDPAERPALSKLSEQYVALYRTQDYLEGRRSEAEGRPPVYTGK
jgi:enoyl-CoA hydratase/carnithine racemase